jgi:hypothetical protein
MKVRFKTLSAGASGVIRPGDVVDVPVGEAELLIRHGYAEAVEIPFSRIPEFISEPEINEPEIAEPKEVKHRKPRAK